MCIRDSLKIIVLDKMIEIQKWASERKVIIDIFFGFRRKSIEATKIQAQRILIGPIFIFSLEFPCTTNTIQCRKQQDQQKEDQQIILNIWE
eukprot:TRINITY_DN45172_c0_g1_i1.p4 TRINITY_DN45172_c0_g1~~TRINITY_DN45172_c0_g1_i1.p4  ORF type:complete len:107 (-),score=12.23 TRINITY_DN45172_c0_g1_i1:255-527(-)